MLQWKGQQEAAQVQEIRKLKEELMSNDLAHKEELASKDLAYKSLETESLKQEVRHSESPFQ